MKTKVCSYCKNDPQELLVKLKQFTNVDNRDRRCVGPFNTKLFGKEVQLCRHCMSIFETLSYVTTTMLPDKYDNVSTDEIFKATDKLLHRHLWVDGRIISATINVADLGWDIFEMYINRGGDFSEILKNAIRQLLTVEFRNNKSIYIKKMPEFSITVEKIDINPVLERLKELKDKAGDDNCKVVTASTNIADLKGEVDRYSVDIDCDALLIPSHTTIIIDKLNKKVHV